MADEPEQWWYDTNKDKAVPDSERPSAQDTLGPYPSKEAAEAWRATRDAREEAWKDEDERWEGEAQD